jgi:predicted nucleic-acid-binding protein
VIGVDSNVLVRFLTRDDEAQYGAAARLFARAPDRSIFLSVIVLVEVNWVLQRVFKRSRSEVLRTLDDLLDSSVFTIEDRARVVRAISLARSTRADFPDALIALGNEAIGCQGTATFDIDALDIPQMVPVEAAAP